MDIKLNLLVYRVSALFFSPPLILCSNECQIKILFLFYFLFSLCCASIDDLENNNSGVSHDMDTCRPYAKLIKKFVPFYNLYLFEQYIS